MIPRDAADSLQAAGLLPVSNGIFGKKVLDFRAEEHYNTFCKKKPQSGFIRKFFGVG